LELYEVLDTNKLVFNCNLVDVNNCKKQRKHIKKLIKSLSELITNIEKAKIAEDIPKIDKKFEIYTKAKNEDLKLESHDKPKLSDSGKQVSAIKSKR
jgi:hypothetical protein